MGGFISESDLAGQQWALHQRAVGIRLIREKEGSLDWHDQEAHQDQWGQTCRTRVPDWVWFCGKALTVIEATKINWYDTSHHTGQGSPAQLIIKALQTVGGCPLQPLEYQQWDDRHTHQGLSLGQYSSIHQCLDAAVNGLFENWGAVEHPRRELLLARALMPTTSAGVLRGAPVRALLDAGQNCPHLWELMSGIAYVFTFMLFIPML